MDTVSGASRYEQPITRRRLGHHRHGRRDKDVRLPTCPISCRAFALLVTNDRNFRYAGIRGLGIPGISGPVPAPGGRVRQNDTVYQAGYMDTRWSSMWT